MSAAKILRNYIGSSFCIDPKKVILSGVISPDFDVNQSTEYTSSAGSSCKIIDVWALVPGDYFIKIRRDISWSTGSGEKYDAPILPLHEVAPKDAICFVVKEVVNDGTWNNSYWTVYQTRDFQTRIAALEAADVQRWEVWASK